MVTRRLQTAILGIAMAEPARRQSELRERRGEGNVMPDVAGSCRRLSSTRDVLANETTLGQRKRIGGMTSVSSDPAESAQLRRKASMLQ